MIRLRFFKTFYFSYFCFTGCLQTSCSLRILLNRVPQNSNLQRKLQLQGFATRRIQVNTRAQYGCVNIYFLLYIQWVCKYIFLIVHTMGV